jgi:hypothetical protein
MTKVIARDRPRGWGLLDGVGSPRVGTMWYEDGPRFAVKDGYEASLERCSTGGFGTPEWRGRPG